jgi:deoxyribodipyrimidine photo-lyase
MLQSRGISFHSYRDQVIFESGEVVKKDGQPYTVYTPYRKRWMEQYLSEGIKLLPPPKTGSFFKSSFLFPDLTRLGFRSSSVRVSPYDLTRLDLYASLRDYPAEDITTRLSPHLRFGTVSIRTIFGQLSPSLEVFMGELIWREFFMQILCHFPKVVTENFNSRYNALEWRNKEEEFERWCNGETGFPLVDAGMRQLNVTGFMHNRVRMVAAGFLCKHLLVDWRWGEAYFAQKLLDYELSSNNGNWQWAAGTGCDAVPYFRIFNPSEQARKYDSAGNYIRHWVPDSETGRYPEPMVDHRQARQRALNTYKKALIPRSSLPGRR